MKPRNLQLWLMGILIFVFYLFLNILFSGFYKTLFLIGIYFETVNWVKLSISIVLSVIIGILVSVNSVIIYKKIKERQACKSSSALTSVGAIGGFAVGICPLCVSGLLPLFLGLFGISLPFVLLPFEGIEIQLIIIIILGLSLYQLNKRSN